MLRSMKDTLRSPIQRVSFLFLALVLAIGIATPLPGFASEEEFVAEQTSVEESEPVEATSEETSDTEEEFGVEENQTTEKPEDTTEADNTSSSEDDHVLEMTEEAADPTLEVTEDSAATTEPEALAATTTVTTFAEFSNAVGAAGVDTILLGADIGMTASVTIPTSKQSLTIDGQNKYTLEQLGLFTLTTASNTSATYTLKNMTIIGRNYYGVVQCAQVSGAPTIVLENISYSGPQVIYNRAGTVAFRGTTSITIVKNGSTSNDAQEIAEAHGVSISGTFNAEFTSTASSFFWMLAVGSKKPFFTIEKGADVSFHTSTKMNARGFLWVEGTAYNVVFRVNEGASLFLDISGYNSFSTDNSHRLDSFFVGAHAHVVFNFAGGIVISNTMTVDEGAVVRLNYLSNPTTGGASYDYPLFRLLRTTGTEPVLNFNNPKAVVLAIQPSDKGFFGLAYNNPVRFQTTDFNYWEAYDAALKQDKPHSMWSSEAKGDLGVTLNLGTLRDNLISIDSNDSALAAEFAPADAQVIQIGTDPYTLIADQQVTSSAETSGTAPQGAKIYADYIDTTGATHHYSGFSAENDRYSIPIDNSSLDSTTNIAITSVTNFVAMRTGVVVGDSGQWIQMRIPTTMLFGTLEEYGTGEIISPQYEIENKSDYPVDVELAGLRVIDDDGIKLLTSADDTKTDTSLNLSLNLDDATVVEYLHPGIGSETPFAPITRLDAGTKRKLTFSGTYYGAFAPSTTYQPSYSLVWSFSPVA